MGTSSSPWIILMLEGALLCPWLAVVAMNEPLLLMVGMDSFRWDFLHRAQTPHFDDIIEGGIKAKHVVNVFPTKSAPNWYTIVTGLYPESHGLVNNHVYDPLVDPDSPSVGFVPNCSNPILWNQTEPIWITNERQGGTSGVLNFPFGMTVRYDGLTANFTTEPGNIFEDKEKIVDNIVALFASRMINLGIIWFPDVDHMCHIHGPESKEATAAVEEMDRMVGYLVEKLKKHNLYDVLNILFVADHGQIEVFPSQVVFLNDSVDRAMYFGFQDNPTFSMFPHKDEDISVIVNKLKDVDHLTVYTKDTIPDEYHYRNNPRIPPIFLMADVGWNVAQDRSETPYWKTTVGEHGYSNNVSQMWPFFVARGPAFRKGILSDPFHSTDIYSLMCHVLQIEPHPHNGSLENVKHLLAFGMPSHQPSVLRTSVVALLFLVAVITCIMLISCRMMLKYRTEANRSVRRIEEVEGLLGDDLDA